MSEQLTQQAFRIADESMIAQLECHSIPMASPEGHTGRRFGLCREDGGYTTRLVEADPSLASAFEWLRQRGLAVLTEVDACEYIVLDTAKTRSANTQPQSSSTTRPADIVPVWYWDAKQYNPDGEDAQADFVMEVEDHRASNGQFFATLATAEGDYDDMLSATIEVNRLPGSKDDVPCLHLHFDADSLAASVFKQGDKFVVRPEANVRLLKTVLPNGERAWILDTPRDS